MFELAGVSGIIYQFSVYKGAPGSEIAVEPFLGFGGSVVHHLCSKIPKHRGYKIFVDNFFTNVNLVNRFSSEGYLICGTLRTNRIPKDCVLKSEAELRRERRGSYDYKTDRSKPVTVVR